MTVFLWLCAVVLSVAALSSIAARLLGYINSCFDEWEQEQ